MPWAETGVALSVIAFGMILAARPLLPMSIAIALVAGFAVFHGYAHGAEMPLDSSGIAYGLGFLTSTGLLHAVGAVCTVVVTGVAQSHAMRAIEVAGAAMTVVGVGLLIGPL